MLINDYYIVPRFCEGEAELEDNDSSHHLYITDGTVVGQYGTDRTLEVGRFPLFYIDVWAAVNAGASVFDIFDSTQEIYDYYAAIFDVGTLDPSPALRRLFKDEVWPGNTLILDRLEILPEFRGYNLGLAVMRRLLERFSAGAAVVAIKPFPLQHPNAREEEGELEWQLKMKFGHLDQDLQRATAKLRLHYAKLGFKLMKDAPFMFRDAQIALPAPHKLASGLVHDKHPPKRNVANSAGRVKT